MIKRAICLLAIVLAGCHSAPTPSMLDEATSRPSVAENDPERWALISKTLGHPGVYARDVYTITIIRDDLMVMADIGDIPPAAGLDTTFYFFKCPCGRTSVTGRFVVADYEA